MWTIIILVLFVLAAIAVLTAAMQAKPARSTGSYKRRKLMTDNECEFFARLVTALPGYYVFPQVAMTALLDASSGNKKTALADRLRIAQQRIDYVICDIKCEVVAVIELDDRTHSDAKDKVRDARLDQAGIRTIRFQSKTKPNAEAIRNAVLPTEAKSVCEASVATDIA